MSKRSLSGPVARDRSARQCVIHTVKSYTEIPLGEDDGMSAGTNIDENGSQREEPVGRRVYVGFGTIWGNVLLVMWFRKVLLLKLIVMLEHQHASEYKTMDKSLTDIGFGN
ncbi:hypothetical protein TNIN_120711 [Trichonephila inaurata madagascariensis]|uniref:Uncharacterized protein n=1 Tax=Trichonephila inaurata madagascariensis TaxID=2747483 RepID=A0A8X6YCS3_9ARAC|nr:hypothetical protein TNIN_120711 [Trichonephila inaurata madagascariensis]